MKDSKFKIGDTVYLIEHYGNSIDITPGKISTISTDGKVYKYEVYIGYGLTKYNLSEDKIFTKDKVKSIFERFMK